MSLKHLEERLKQSKPSRNVGGFNECGFSLCILIYAFQSMYFSGYLFKVMVYQGGGT